MTTITKYSKIPSFFINIQYISVYIYLYISYIYILYARVRIYENVHLYMDNSVMEKFVESL